MPENQVEKGRQTYRCECGSQERRKLRPEPPPARAGPRAVSGWQDPALPRGRVWFSLVSAQAAAFVSGSAEKRVVWRRGAASRQLCPRGRGGCPPCACHPSPISLSHSQLIPAFSVYTVAPDTHSWAQSEHGCAPRGLRKNVLRSIVQGHQNLGNPNLSLNSRMTS